MIGMAMARSASGGTGVGPGAKRYFFCMTVSSINTDERKGSSGCLFICGESVMVLYEDDYSPAGAGPMPVVGVSLG